MLPQPVRITPDVQTSPSPIEPLPASREAADNRFMSTARLSEDTAPEPTRSRLSRQERDALRDRQLAQIPSWYSPWAHLAVPAIFGLGVMATCVHLLRGLRTGELLVIPFVLLLSNAVEWRAHKYVLHKRTWYLPVLYDRHTPVHHMIYLTRDMVMRSTREFALVLIPFYGIIAIFLMQFPLAALLWWAGLRNIACLFVATSMFYVLSYEWLHLAYHAPADSFVGRLGFVATLRRHHAIHHSPERMQKWNFNVTLPLWDLVRGTFYSGPDPFEDQESEAGISDDAD
jgi:sterol desaturase/sphingolipid hydroxylase (fatty acid hydroxylase superfamily)